MTAPDDAIDHRTTSPARWAWRAANERVRRIPLAVALLTALFGALGILHSFITPLGSAPDETTHADMVFWMAEGHPYPEFDGRLLSRSVFGVGFGYANSELLPNTPEKFDGVRADAQRPFGEMDLDVADRDDRYNQMAQHPPLYYESASLLVRVDRTLHGGATGWFGEWHRLRIASFAPMVALPLLAWSTARRLGASEEAAVTASVFMLAVPQLLHITAALNNDTYVVVFGAVVAWLLAGVLRDGPRRGRAAVIGVFVGTALLTKAFALVFPPWVAVVYARRARRHRDEVGRSVRDVLIAAVVSTVVAGWWWIGNVVRHGSPAPTTERWLYTTEMQPPGFEPDRGWFVLRFAAWMPRRFFGWFGWFTVPLAVGFAIAASMVVAAGVAFAFGRRSPGVSRFDLAAVLSVVPMLLVFVFVRAHSLYTTTGRTPFIQGRYLFAGFVPIAVVVGVGLAAVLGRRAPAVLLAGAVVMQVAALRVLLRAFWGTADAAWSERVDALRAWNPGLVDPWWWTLAVVLPVAVATAVAVVRVARPPATN